MNKNILLVAAFSCFAAFGFAQIKVVAPNGDVGIGTSNPTEKLELNGNMIIGNDQSFLAYRSDGVTPHRLMRLNPFNEIIFNSSAIVDDATSGLVFGATTYIDFRDKNNLRVLRVRANTGNHGFVGIGNIVNPAERLQVSGNILASGTLTGSDRRIKKNIRNFDLGLESLMKIEPRMYEYNGKADISSDHIHVGVIAQEFEKIAPFAVGEFEFEKEDGEGQVVEKEVYKWVDEKAIQYMLVNAVKEQQIMIEELQDQISELKAEMNDGIGAANEDDDNEFYLKQNQPNPHNGFTTINYLLPYQSTNNKLIITDISGRVLKSVDLDSSERKSSVTIEMSWLPVGSYTYSLESDGKIMDSKIMVQIK